MENIYCPCCSGNSVKNGLQNNKQRYKCKVCGKSFQHEYTYRAYHQDVDTLIKSLLKESCGIRSISRVIGISTKTVLSRILKISKGIKIPYFNKLGCKFEVDEMWTFIKRKEDFTWITYVLERETRSIIDFFVGSNTPIY